MQLASLQSAEHAQAAQREELTRQAEQRAADQTREHAAELGRTQGEHEIGLARAVATHAANQTNAEATLRKEHATLLAAEQEDSQAKEAAARQLLEEQRQQHELALSTTKLVLDNQHKTALASALDEAHDSAKQAEESAAEAAALQLSEATRAQCVLVCPAVASHANFSECLLAAVCTRELKHLEQLNQLSTQHSSALAAKHEEYRKLLAEAEARHEEAILAAEETERGCVKSMWVT